MTSVAAGIILSIAPNVSIITARILDWQGKDAGKLDQAIEFVTARGADIILMPITILDPEPTSRYIDKVQSEIINAYSRQVRFIISAQGRGRHHSHRFPGYLGGVYNIAGVDRQGNYSLTAPPMSLTLDLHPVNKFRD
ncbi:MAG: hypothetical protein U5N58_02465 [Actinomycetota bacterium]|nr:hypothetical protein [Actinomycetota bacterium]